MSRWHVPEAENSGGEPGMELSEFRRKGRLPEATGKDRAESRKKGWKLRSQTEV